MYSDCVSCDRGLGRNTELPGFPVGRRIAFDRETGRLWVICRHCEEWNLAVLETRWEAVEAADRLATASEVSANGAEMGLARTAGGLELLRVGGLSRADIANWRYGRIVARRRRFAYVTIAVLGLLAAGVGAAATKASGSGFAGLYVAAVLGFLAWWVLQRWPSVLAWGRTRTGRRWLVCDLFGESLRLKFEAEKPVLQAPGLLRNKQYLGRDALEVAARLIAQRSWSSLHAADVADAVEWVDLAEKRSRRRAAWWQIAKDAPRGHIMRLTLSQQLALEMALREELDRLDMAAEASAAREDWVKADEVGRISDDLLLPDRIVAWMRARRR
jgi:hypothetical protein